MWSPTRREGSFESGRQKESPALFNVFYWLSKASRMEAKPIRKTRRPLSGLLLAFPGPTVSRISDAPPPGRIVGRGLAVTFAQRGDIVP